MINNLLKPYQSSLSEHLQSAFYEDNKRAGKFFLQLLTIHWVIAATVMAYAYDTWIFGFTSGFLVTAGYYFVYRMDKGGLLTRIAAGCAIMAFSAIYIQQHFGRLEMHFHVFIGMAFLLRFKDPMPVLAAALTIATHHFTINFCQAQNISILGSPLVVFNYGSGMNIVLMHTAFVLAEAIVIWLMIDDEIFHFVQLNKNLRQTKDILETVKEGLLLLDENRIVSNQHSKSLESIFNTTELSGKTLDEILKPLVTEKTLSTTRDYINILFKQKVNEKLVRELNPLDKVEINIGQSDGEYSVKYIECSFSRVTREKNIKQVLMTISDITERVRLETALKQSTVSSQEQFAVLSSILHIEPKGLYDFIVSAKEKLMTINKYLRESSRNSQEHEAKLLRISRLAHSLKGDAGILDLQYIVDKVHKFEDVIASIRAKDNITGDCFLPLTVKLNHLIKDIELIYELCNKLQSLSQQSLPSKTEASAERVSDGVWKRFELMTNTIAEEQGKLVKLIDDGFRDLVIASRLHSSINDILVQCIRNAIVHGIETPEERLHHHKLAYGCVHIQAQINDSRLVLRIRDDGQGINLTKVKEQVLALKLCSPERIDLLSHQQLINSIFHPGFSTANRVNHNAGRGIGMELIRREAKRLGGKLGLSTKTGIYTEIKVTLPLAQNLDKGDYEFCQGVA